MPKPRRSAGMFVISCSSNAIDPASGCSSPAIILRVVVFPHPDGPNKPKNSPRSTSRDTSVTAAVLSKRLERFLRESSGIVFQPLCNLCSLCVSVNACFTKLTTETQSTKRLHRETNSFLTTPANLGVPITQPFAALLAQQIPVKRHFVDTRVHPDRQLSSINVAAYWNAIVFLCGKHEALGRSYKFVEPFRLFRIWPAPYDSDAVSYYRRAAGWKRVADGKPFLLLVNPDVRKIPQSDKPFATHQFLHQERAVGGIFMHIRI